MFSDYLEIVKEKSTENEYCIDFLIPGVNKEDIEISFDDNILSVTSKKITFFGRKYNNKIKVVAGTGKEIDMNRLSANLKNGILTVKIPFKAKAPKKAINIIKIDE